MTQSTLRIHAAVGFARVGNSAEYYIEPQTSAAQSDTGEDGVTTGGLLVVPDTQSRTIRESGPCASTCLLSVRRCDDVELLRQMRDVSRADAAATSDHPYSTLQPSRDVRRIVLG